MAESYYNIHIFMPISPRDPNNPNNIIKKIIEKVNNIDLYLTRPSDPLKNNYFKYISNINIFGICMQNLLHPGIRISTYILSTAYVSLSTYYQHKRNNAYPLFNKNIIDYGSYMGLKSLVLFPLLTCTLYKPYKSYFVNKIRHGVLFIYLFPFIYFFDKPLGIISNMVIEYLKNK